MQEERAGAKNTGYPQPGKSELETAIRRLTYVDAYTRHQDKYYDHKGNPHYAAWWNETEEKLLQGIVAETYKHLPAYKRISNGYEADKTILKNYIRNKSIEEVPRIIQGRLNLLRNLAKTYSSNEKLSSLAESIAVILCYRAGLPFLQTAETRNHDFSDIVSPSIAYLEPSPEKKPDTFSELSSRYKKQQAGPIVVALINALSDPGAKLPVWHEWSGRKGPGDPHGSPFHERFDALKKVYREHTMESLRKKIYSAHPLCLVIDKLYSPFELADIIRMSDVGARNMALTGIIEKIALVIKEANDEL
ncbi:MAG: hypothetical protein MJA29_06635, partial [Candidatus Omnitrophica bacterium]|nr:hypothetical protein [Candidatus Omnitrophota bacterium]